MVSMIEHERRHRNGAVRADAARNRQLIIDSAAQIFAQHGAKADVREIAALAGVGMGTLYRHFPTKEKLLETVLEQDFFAWIHAARVAADTERDPGRALSNFLRDALGRQGRHRALSERFAASMEQPGDRDVCRQKLHPFMDELVLRCQHADLIRQDVTGEDISVLLMGLATIARLAEQQQRPELAVRALSTVLAGLDLRDGDGY